MISAASALERLREGNRRFVSGAFARDAVATPTRRGELAAGQEPFAVVIGCSDSRVPAEIVFDQGLGDLFVVRVAGNIVAPSQIGSVEFAVARFGTPLVVVLGHARCGAVLATLEQLEPEARSRSSNLASIVESIRPAVEPLLARRSRVEPSAFVRACVHANVRAGVEKLKSGSELLAPLAAAGSLLVVGAKYSLETGVVEFLDRA